MLKRDKREISSRERETQLFFFALHKVRGRWDREETNWKLEEEEAGERRRRDAENKGHAQSRKVENENEAEEIEQISRIKVNFLSLSHFILSDEWK